MTDERSTIPIVTSVEPLLDGVDAWICDLWGVVHNGVDVFRPAIDACLRFRQGGGAVVFLTNAPRPADAIIKQLDQLGVPREAYDHVLTSGDLTLSLISERSHRPLLHLGPARDAGLFDGLEVTFVDFAEAETVVCSGLFDDEADRAEDYRGPLRQCADRNVPMICANPDLQVARGDRLIECAGAVAAVYEHLGGRVTYAGKPHLPVYQKAFDVLGRTMGRAITADTVLAIGDGLHTDMLGAANSGLRSVFVASPIHLHRPLEKLTLRELFADHPATPVAAMPGLAW